MTLRVLSWPLTGLIADGFVAASLAAVGVIAVVVWRWRAPDRGERFVVRWFGLGLLWSIVFLTIAAPSLAVVVRGLPNDHYHAFADPMVFTLVGLVVAALVREMRAPAGARRRGRRRRRAPWLEPDPPPARRPPRRRFPGRRRRRTLVDATLSEQGIDRADPTEIRSLPDFKSPEAMVYPLARIGRAYAATLPKGAPTLGNAPSSGARGSLVVLCDQLFRASIGADCGGPAEDAFAAAKGLTDPRVDRIKAAPGRWVSVYVPAD